MNVVVEKFVQPMVTRSLNLATQGIKGSRRLAATGSDLISSSTSTVSFASDKALKLNKITHATFAKLVSEQGHMVEGTLKAAARRLDVAANANSFQDLWADQLELMPKSRKRITKDAKKVIEIFADTREDLGELVTETISEFSNRGKKVAKTRKAVVKKATRTAKAVKKSAKKTAKKTATTAKKRTARATKAVRKTAKKRTTRKTAKRRS